MKKKYTNIFNKIFKDLNFFVMIIKYIIDNNLDKY